jgi:hypothetical protein
MTASSPQRRLSAFPLPRCESQYAKSEIP